MRALCYAQTNIGSGRDNNEDNYYCNGTFKRDPAIPVAEAAAEQESKRLIYGVFDGMGGEANGEQAALLCAQTLHACSSDEPFDALDFFRRANVAVCDMIAASGQISGSTAATVHLTGNHAYCCNVGDSRIYRLRCGRMEQLTQDHSLVGELVRAGILTAEEARTHPRRNIITRALGTEGDNTPDLLAADLQPGDRFLLCTDGLTGMVRDDEIERTLLDSQTADEAADRLIQMALDAGGSDNVTLILCTGEEGKPWKQD